ncbi:hypothetical protein CASFOL_039625 [Castilleja foliolosa]|uniref:OVATE domain-containing protein n=1 Tax=Castilleja foliolosa TaxID=1961234 RepID=A0ABD3BFQ9_9LAMI
MNVGASLKRKLLKPCKKLLHLFKLRPHKPLFIKALRFHRKKPKNNVLRTPIPKIKSFFNALSRTREMDRVTELKSFSEAEHHRAPYPSPITPAYIRLMGLDEVDSDRDDVDETCRSFENYLVDMIVEDGNVRDLADVEEVLYCWENLRCPVYVDLVSKFYGEMCNDLFSSGSEIGKGTINGFMR